MRDGEKVRIRIRDDQSGSYFLELGSDFLGKILIFFDADPGSGMEKIWTRELGWKKVGSGIQDKYPGSPTLV
jgi:hypothetical protein